MTACTLRVSLDKVYGNEVVRPVTTEAHLLCQLAGTKTFTQTMINTCKKLGYTFEVVGVPSTQFSF